MTIFHARELGQTGLTVTPLGLGLAALGRPGYINLQHAADLQGNYAPEAMAAHTARVLDAAWEAGIRYFDTARSYGLGERFLAGWLRGRNHTPQDQVVASKWGYTYTADWQVDAAQHEVKEHSPAVFDRQWEETRAELGDYLKVYQTHSATFDSGGLTDPNVLGRMYSLREHNVAIGLTLSGVEQAEAIVHAVQVIANGAPLIDTIQATWNLLEPSAGGALSYARRMGVGIIVKEALANGRLTARNRAPKFAPKLALLQSIAHELDTTVDAVALAAALHQPWADVVLSGAATPEQVTANAAALRLELTPDHLERLAGLAESPPDYWQTRARLPWN